MEFGSEKTFALINDILNNEKPYDELFDIIREDSLPAIRRDEHILKYEWEDVVSEIQIKVLQSLVDFFFSPDSGSVGQRNNWFKAVVGTVISDYKRKTRKARYWEFSEGDLLGNDTDSEDGDGEVLDWLSASQSKNRGHGITERSGVSRVELYECLRALSSLRSDPSNIMAFLLNCMSRNPNGKNGNPDDIVERFRGKPLREVYETMISGLVFFTGCSLPEDTFSELRNRLKPIENMPFLMTPRQIAVNSYDIRKKIK